jgi:hypothetical protein
VTAYEMNEKLANPGNVINEKPNTAMGIINILLFLFLLAVFLLVFPSCSSSLLSPSDGSCFLPIDFS